MQFTQRTLSFQNKYPFLMKLDIQDCDKFNDLENHVECSDACNISLPSKKEPTKHKDICIKVLKNVIKLTRSDPKEMCNLMNFNNWLYDNDIFSKINKVKILNFSPNIEYIKSTISEETNNNYDKCCNYIKECVELYEIIKKETCSKNSPNSFFCKPLEDFKMKYETLNSTFISRHKFPSSLGKSQKIEISCPNIDSKTEVDSPISKHSL
ncbi:PIR Superfamily Protein [Plasmodium ovale wallikeri]|uniref:PIR Superfamily Protein n=1 Tax=Plasmodium ovale wallikeri TaxID=864142 RepID=A0A1A9ASG6_PLAOA|nr:PIR Superfamily Protein [Plasmodium ovale wallikeri]